MHPQPGHATRFEKSPGGVTRAHGVAHSRMIHQLARAEYLSKRWLWPIMASATVVVPVVVVLSGSESLSGENFRYLLYGLAFVVVLGVGLFAVFGLGLLYLAGPRIWSLKLPVGTPVSAEFRPDSVGIGWLDHFNAVYLDQIVRVRHIASVLVVQGVGDVELLIPDELVPPDIAPGLLSTFKQRRRPPQAGMSSPHPQPGAPSAPGIDGVTRTAAIADAGLADRLGAAVQRSVVTRLALALAILVPLTMLGYSYVENGQLSWSSVLAAAAVLAAGVGAIGYVVYIATPTKFRQLVPPCAAIAAEFGPQQISVRLGGHLQTVQLGAVERIWHADQVFHVSVRGPGAGLIIPEQLVPPHVVSGLFMHFGAA
ncbi:hypothetical protein [Mycobacterium sp. NPDC050441]|uniref:hypothetical protein n=1 Tax=Mycobacterium sp. NPDC050441 TaxID=3155403 RepID=UPI0033E772C7